MDPYDLCPCGSGKKVKFCCQKLVPEMDKIERLQENQPELALQHLEKLREKHPGNPWVITTLAGIMMQEGDFASAKIELLKFLKEHPDHPRANALYGFASLNVDGFPACKKAVHRAFKRCVTESPRIVSALMEALGEHHLMSGRLLAARAHFVLAMRVATTEEARKGLVGLIMRIDSDTSIPFAFRGGHNLPEYSPPAPLKEAVEKARRLSLLACWEEAADLLEKGSSADSESARLWHTIGLLRAWDGDEQKAASALHKAAGIYDDAAAAVECEVIAQLLDHTQPGQSTPVRLKRYKISSVSQLLSRLDSDARFVRGNVTENEERMPGDPVAAYLLLDRPVPARDDLERLSAQDVPLYLGRVLVFDVSAEDDLPAMAFVTGLEGEVLDALQAEFLKAAGDLASTLTEAEFPPESELAGGSGGERDILGRIPSDQVPLHRNYYVPPGAPGNVRRQIQDAHWNDLLTNSWPETPQAALHGKTPREAAGDPKLAVALRAAVHLLDSFFDERSQMLPIEDVREVVKLDKLPPPQIDEQTPISMLSSFEMLRVDILRLTNRQLSQLVERLTYSRHSRLLYEALSEYIERTWRDDETPFLSAESAIAALMDLAAEARNADEALQWSRRGRELAAQSEENAFERNLTWKLRELRVRVAMGHPDELRDLLVDLWENYGAKLPSLREQLMQAVETIGIDPPWETAIVTADSGSGTSWSPAAAAAEPARKLWLPGQD